MNLINVLCFIFLTTYACASSDETLMTSTDLTSSTDGSTTDRTSLETSTDISDLSSDTPDTTEDLSDSITLTTPSYDGSSTETQITTDASTDVVIVDKLDETTKKPGIVPPSLIPRGHFETGDRSPKPLEPSSDGKGHELEIPEEKETDGGKKKLNNTIDPSILTAEDSGEGLDSEILEGIDIDATGTEKSMKNTEEGNESKVSKGKAAGILVASCILAVVLIWISKMVYTRYQSRTYDVRHGMEMRNP